MMHFDLDKYNSSIKTDYIGRNLVYLENTDSTNSYASKLLSEKEENQGKSRFNGTVILAEIQKEGKGRFERKWISPAGGLWFTIILKTVLEPIDLMEVALIAAYSIVTELEKVYSISAFIKWPNDIYYENLKLGGILTEVEKKSNNTYLIMGIGLNANLVKNDLDPYSEKSTSIKIILGKDIERETLLSDILFNFESDYEYYSRTKDFKTIFKKIEKKLEFI